MATVTAVLAAAAVATAGCSGQQGAAVAPKVPAPSTPSTPAPSASSTVAPRPAPAVAKAAQLARSVPVRLQVPAIGVDSDLMRLGLRANKTMEVPPGGFPAGWYTGMATPGELGTAVIVGHVDMNGPGVFYKLHSLKRGDKVTVTRKDGTRPVFRVTRVARVPKDSFPTKLVYGYVGRPVLRLITCGGSFNQSTGHYEDNIVVFADLVTPGR